MVGPLIKVYVFLTTAILDLNEWHPVSVRKLVCKASDQPHCLTTAGPFVLDSWARAIKGSLGRVLIHYACLWCNVLTSLSLVSYAAIFCRSSLNATTQTLRKWYFLPTSPHMPFKYCFPFQTKLNPCMEFKEKFEQVYDTFFYLKKLIAAIHCTYKAELQSYFQS